LVRFLPFCRSSTILRRSSNLVDGLYQTVADVSNVALTIQSIVSNPASAPMDISGLIGGGGKGASDRDEIESIAAKRRALSKADLSDLGKDFKKDNDEFEEEIAASCRTWADSALNTTSNAVSKRSISLVCENSVY
jgi:hypothetical protein